MAAAVLCSLSRQLRVPLALGVAGLVPQTLLVLRLCPALALVCLPRLCVFRAVASRSTCACVSVAPLCCQTWRTRENESVEKLVFVYPSS